MRASISIAVVAALAALLMLMGAGGGRPDTRQMAAMVLSRHASPEWMDIRAFRVRKTLESPDQPHQYVVDVSYTLVPRRDASQAVDDQLKREGYNPDATDEQTALRRKEIGASIVGGLGAFKTGVGLDIREQVVFMRNKGGWYIQETRRPVGAAP